MFWVISSDLDSYAQLEVAQKDRPRGMLYQGDDPSVTIWVKTRSQVISDCRSRLQFFSEKLNYMPDRDSSLEHLKKAYNKYLADLFPAKAEGDDEDNSKIVAGS